MQKRVLAFLLVLALVFSLLPVALVAAEEETVAPGYVLYLQKAHNQPSEGVAIDVYLQATTAGQPDVTGYEFTVQPADGLTVTVPDTHTDGSLSAGGTDNVLVYNPAQTDASFAVGTKRVRIATINLSGTTTAEDAVVLSGVTITAATGFYSDDAEDVSVENYLGAVTQTTVALNDAWADVTGEWTALDQATLDAASNTLTGNYYLVEDIAATAQVVASNANLDLNGYSFASANNSNLLKAGSGNLTINDCTATGSALDGTLVAGTLVASNHSYGGCLYAARNATLTVSNVNIDASAVEGSDSGYLLYSLGEYYNVATSGKVTNYTTYGSIYANNVHLFGGKAKTGATDPVYMVDARGYIELNDVLFSDFDLTPNSDKDTLTNALMSARHQTDGGMLVLNNVITEECGNYSVYVMNTDNNMFKSLTVKGTTKLADPIYVANVGTKVTLDLDEGAEVTIETAELLTAEEFSNVAAVVDTLPAGTLYYKNAEQYVTYSDGAFAFTSHAHDDVAFKAWKETDSLPTSGNYYLYNNVEITEEYTIDFGATLTLDLNGKTITQKAAGTRVYDVNGTLNLYDCESGYAEGSWIGGVITGGTGSTGGAIRVSCTEEGETEDSGAPTFNMYGGSISGNSSDKGGAIHVSGSTAAVNIYDGLLSENTASVRGGAIHAINASAVNIQGGVFKNNSATAPVLTAAERTALADDGGAYEAGCGGAIFYYSRNKLTVNNATFEGNSAADNNSGQAYSNYGSGGAIFVGDTDLNAIAISNSVFKNNSAYAKTSSGNNNRYGGAIMGYYAHRVTISNCEFTGNTTNGGGGAFAQRGSGSTKTRINDTIITENQGAYCGAIYTQPSAPLYLNNTVITGNTTTSTKGGAVYLVNPGTRLVVSGKTVIADNIKSVTSKTLDYTEEKTTTTTDAETGEVTTVTTYEKKTRTVDTSIEADVYVQWQDNQKRTNLLEVKDLEEGSCINLFYPDYDQGKETTNADGSTKYNITESGSVLHTSNLASDWVRICDDTGSTQADWSCGMVTAYDYDHPNGRSISRVDGQFVFGHYHEVNGQMVEYTGINALSEAVAGEGTTYVYLKGDITATKAGTYGSSGATYGFNPSFDVNICLNGKTLDGSLTNIIYLTTGNTITIEDCTEHYDAAGEYAAGTITNKNAGGYGKGIRIQNGSVIMNGGRVYGFKGGTGNDVNGIAVYVYPDASASASFEMNGGLVGGVTQTHTSTTNYQGGVIWGRNRSGATTVVKLHGGTIADISLTKNGTTKANETSGGVIWLNAANCVVENMTFKNISIVNNTAVIADDGITVSTMQTTTGGVVSVSSDIPVRNCQFIECSVSGGIIYGGIVNKGGTAGAVEDCTFENCTVTATGNIYGGMARAIATDGDLTRLTFNNCTATSGKTVYGGIALIGNSSSTTNNVTDCTFSNCTVTSTLATNGGIMYSVGLNPTATGNVFTDITVNAGTTLYGGALYQTRNSGKVTVENNTFANVVAHSGTGNCLGGAIYFNCTNNNYVNNNTFTNVAATSDKEAYGGACYFLSKNITQFNNNTFVGCSAKHSGGAVYLRGASMTAENLTITDCTAQTGAAMVIWHGAVLNLNGAEITGNYNSTNSSGAVELGHNSTNYAVLNLSGKVVIDGNTQKNGNASDVFMNGSHISIAEAGLAEGSSIGIEAAAANITAGNYMITNDVSSDVSAYFHSNDNYGIVSMSATSPVVTYTDAVAPTNASEGNAAQAIVTEAQAAVEAGTYSSIETLSVTISDVTYEYLISYVLADQSDEAPERLYFVSAKVNDTYYHVLQDAVTAAEGTEDVVTLLGKNSEALTATSDVTIDLNGKTANTINMAADTTLTLIDSTTNDYDCADGYGTITKTGEGTYESSVVYTDANNKLRRYAVIADAETGKLSAHRVYLAITTKTLRPANVGIGFKAVFAGDQYVTENLESFGLELSFYENFIDPETNERSVFAAAFTSMAAGPGVGDEYGKPNMKTIVISDILTKDEEAGTTNTEMWNVDLNGIPYITVGGVTVYGNAVSVNMADMSANALASGTEDAKTMVAEMMTTFGITAE